VQKKDILNASKAHFKCNIVLKLLQRLY